MDNLGWPPLIERRSRNKVSMLYKIRTDQIYIPSEVLKFNARRQDSYSCLILLSMPTSTLSSQVLFACGTHFLPSPNLVHPWLASKLLWRILLSTIPSLIKFTSFVLVSQSLHLGCFEHILPILYPYAYNIHQWKYFYDYFYSMKLLNRSIPWLKVMKFSKNLCPFC